MNDDEGTSVQVGVGLVDHYDDDDDDDDQFGPSHAYINILPPRLHLRNTHEMRKNAITLHLRIHPNHGYSDERLRDFLIQVISAMPLLEHVDITCPPPLSFLQQQQHQPNQDGTNGDWSVQNLTFFLREIHRQERTIISLRIACMRLIGSSFAHFQEWGQSIQQLESLERFSLDKIGLAKLQSDDDDGTTTPPPHDREGCWLGPIVSGLAILPQIQHVRILGATDFQHMTTPATAENENGNNDEEPVIGSSPLRELCKSSSLRSLCLIHFNLTDDNVKSMAEQLETNPSIKEFDIDCTLGKDSSLALERLFQHNTSLEDVNLCVRSPEDNINNGEDDAMTEQMETLLAGEDEINLPLVRGVGQSHLSSFALFRGHLSPTSQDAFRTMMVEQSTLKSLTLYCGDETTNAALQTDPIIKFYCKLNNLGRRQLLLTHQQPTLPAGDSSSLPINPYSVFTPELSLVDTMGRVSNDLSCLYYFLSLSPSLCNRAAIICTTTNQQQQRKVKKHNRRKGASSSLGRRRRRSSPVIKRTRLYRAAKYKGVQYAE